MTGNKAYLAEYQDYNGGPVAFGEAEYVAAVNCCGQVLWIQNQMLDYGFNFMNTKIYIDNESTICIVKNPVFHSKTKHIAIRHHFIRDAYEKKLIQVLKIHTDDNVADLLTKAFDVSRYITAKVTGKPVSISEASIRSDLLFNDADGIDSLPNQAIFDAIQLMGTDQHETQTNPSPRPSPTSHITDSIPEGSGGNHGGQSSSDRSLLGNEGGMTLQSVYDLCISLCTQVTDQAKEIKHLKAQIKKLKKKAKPVITHHRAWMKSVSMKQRLAGKKSLKKQWMQMESVSKQGRKSAKAEPTVHKDPAFDELDDDAIDYMETEDAQDVGRTRYVVHKEKESAEKEVSTEDALNTAQPKVSTDKEEVSTDRPDEGTDKQKVSTDKEENKEKLKEKEKGVELKDVEETERPRPTSTRSLLTLKPLPKIDPKDKGKKKIEKEDESDTESEGITEAEKKFKQLARDEEVARKVQEDWEADERKQDLMSDIDILLDNFKRERELYTIGAESHFFMYHWLPRRFLAQQRSEAIRNKPPLRNQLRNQMMTYLKHVGGKKHSDLKTKSFEEIKDLYDKIKRFDDSFIAIGSAEDEKVIKERNKQVADASKKRVKKDDNIKKKELEKESLTKKILQLHWMAVLSILDRDDIGAIIKLVIDKGKYGFWNAQQKLEDKNKYPLKKEVMSQLLKLKLETEEDSTMALELIRLAKKQIAELDPEDSDGDEKDL
ncbi:hypothetical protein Tco_0204639 [Tanacetum coccineum]